LRVSLHANAVHFEYNFLSSFGNTTMTRWRPSLQLMINIDRRVLS
jgi:hypothetical protein